jgi:hypothetical protein
VGPQEHVVEPRLVALAAVAGSFVASGLLTGMLLEGWPELRSSAGAARVAAMLATLTSTALLAILLVSIADPLQLTRASSDEWVEHAALNALGVSIILHVAIGRRWPFAGGRDAHPDDAVVRPRRGDDRLDPCEV